MRALASALCVTSVLGAPTAPVNVSLADGTVILGAPGLEGVASYWGIRYATAERFALAEPFSYPPGTVLGRDRDTKRWCWQRGTGGQGHTFLGEEDCLFLDVNVPLEAPLERTRVATMVWIHGGTLVTGGKDDASYDEDYQNFVAEGGVAMVRINYRVNVLGFFVDADGEVPANNGIRDQILALKWVQANIAAFGGDPGRVTIFGESAGGLSVMVLQQSPLAQGLFHRAIAQSPAWQDVAQFHHPVRDAAASMARWCMEAAGCSSVACLRALPLDKLGEACSTYVDASFSSIEVAYFTGFDGDVVPAALYSKLCAGEPVANAKVPLMVGSLPNEGRLFDLVLSTENATRKFVREHFRAEDEVTQQCVHEKLLSLYGGARKSSKCPLCFLFRGRTDAVQLNGDIQVTLGAQLAASAVGGPRYRYLFDTESGGGLVGATHAMDMAYFAEKPYSEDLSIGVLKRRQKRALGKIVREYWTSFAKSGVPSSSSAPAWASVDGSPGSLGLPMMHLRLEGSRMDSNGFFTNASAELLADVACGRVDAQKLGCGNQPRLV